MMTIEEQSRRFEHVAPQAYELMVAFVQLNRDRIMRAAAQRMNGVGLDDYGDSTWHRPPRQLGAEAIAEFADALFYLSVAVDRLGFVPALQMLTHIKDEDISND